MPNDPRLLSLSPAQEFWIYAHIKRGQVAETKKMYDLAKLICSFINPEAAKSLFQTPVDTVENVGFLDDIRKIDPNFDESKYSEMMD